MTLSMLRTRFVRFLGDALADEGGATAIEYGIIAAGVGAFIAATVWSLGSSLQTNFYDKLSNMF